MPKPKAPKRGMALFVGAAACAVCAGVFLAGGFDRLDRFGLAEHLRHLSGVRADESIVMIDIDDPAIEAIGGWPWPRRRLADAVTVLSDAGARRIVLDVLLSDAAPPRLQPDPAFVFGPGEWSLLGDADAPTLIDDDAELARAMRMAGSVILPVVGRSGDGRPGGSPRAVRAADAHLAKVLASDFSVTRDEAAAGAPTELSPELVERRYESVKRRVARELARAALEAEEDVGFGAFVKAVLPGLGDDVIDPSRAILWTAFASERGRRSVLDRLPRRAEAGRVASESREEGAPAVEIAAPLERFAEAAAGFGFVSGANRDELGMVWGVPARLRIGERYCVPLGLAALPELVSSEPPALVPDPGELLLQWHVPGSGDWRDSFAHIPITQVLHVASLRRTQAENHRRIRMFYDRLLRVRHRETQHLLQEYIDAVLAMRQAEADGAAAGAEVRATVEAAEADARAWLERTHPLWAGLEPENEQDAQEREEILALAAFSRRADGMLATNKRMRGEELAAMAGVRQLVEGRTCFVGHTGTGVADLVSTPVYDLLPGVMVHANVMNCALHRAFVGRISRLAELVVLIVCGLLAALAASRFSVRRGLLAALLLGGVVVAVGAAAFVIENLYVATVPMAATIGASWAAAGVQRQLIDERARRRLRRALEQYTSPEVAAEIVGKVSGEAMAPTEVEVTCFVCDLSGFTALSERLGPRRTRDLLNPYLDHVAQHVFAAGGLVNKFIGDGVFAFFNAPIRECSDHASAAVRCARAIVSGWEDVRRRVNLAVGEDVDLRLRIGIATGEAFVGDYGGSVKLDYTCIGDTANVAARLEAMNKRFGTTIMVLEETAERAKLGEEFAALLGERVPGRGGALNVRCFPAPAVARTGETSEATPARSASTG